MATIPIVDLEILLYPHHVVGTAASYAVRCRISSPDDEADVDPLDGRLVLVHLDFQRLAALNVDSDAYGRALGAAFFDDAAMAGAIAAALAAADRLEGENGAAAPLRIRLGIGVGDLRLHAVRWELLYRADGRGPLFQGDRIYFSRYLSSGDWRRVRRRSAGDLRALVVVANPTDIASGPSERDRLAVPTREILDDAVAALQGVQVTTLSDGRATWEELADRLGDGFDIVYVVCHGRLADGIPKLWLERPDGTVDVVDGERLVGRIRSLLRVPHLVVLASCQSAGRGEPAWEGDNALAALGPRLAAAGVPAVVAMHGDVTMATTRALLPAFFGELLEHGQIDRALSAARVGVARRDDWWMPVLFMRLKTGRLWHGTGAVADAEFPKWPAILTSIAAGNCVPILGPALFDSLLGSRKEIALRWAERNNLPMAIHERDDLPQVAQILAINQSQEFISQRLIEHLCCELRRLYPAELAAAGAPREVADGPTLLRLLTIAERARQHDDPASPYRVLARLPAAVFITTSPSDLLEEALEDVGKAPRVAICDWDRPGGEPIAVRTWDRPGGGAPAGGGGGAPVVPTREAPLVFHAFGHFADQFSLVLTEDNYFSYLIKFTLGRGGQPGTIPSAIADAMANKSLLFLGFQLEDWSFRVLFRLIMDYPGLRHRFAHVAVQLEPDEDELRRPDRARGYLQEYFKHANIDVFWGTAEEFLRSLHQRLPRPHRAER